MAENFFADPSFLSRPAVRMPRVHSSWCIEVSVGLLSLAHEVEYRVDIQLQLLVRECLQEITCALYGLINIGVIERAWSWKLSPTRRRPRTSSAVRTHGRASPSSSRTAPASSRRSIPPSSSTATSASPISTTAAPSSLWNPGWLQSWSGRLSERGILRDLGSLGAAICNEAAKHRPALDDFISCDATAELLLSAYAEVAPGWIPPLGRLVRTIEKNCAQMRR